MFVVSLATNGVFLASRPHEIVRPDGKVVKAGKILQWWYYLWHKQKDGEPERVYFQGKELTCLANKIKHHAKNAEVSLHGTARLLVNKVVFDNSQNLQNVCDACFDFEEYENGLYLMRAYQEFERYVFPEWVRDMMAGCITCHPTFYGNIGFWVIVGIFGVDIQSVYHFSVWQVIAIWVAFWLSLAYVNTWLYQRIKP